MLRVIKKSSPDDEMIKRIVRKLDTDGDGLVSLEEIMVLARKAEKSMEGSGILKIGSETKE